MFPYISLLLSSCHICLSSFYSSLICLCIHSGHSFFGNFWYNLSGNICHPLILFCKFFSSIRLCNHLDTSHRSFYISFFQLVWNICLHPWCCHIDFDHQHPHKSEKNKICSYLSQIQLYTLFKSTFNGEKRSKGYSCSPFSVWLNSACLSSAWPFKLNIIMLK